MGPSNQEVKYIYQFVILAEDSGLRCDDERPGAGGAGH